MKTIKKFMLGLAMVAMIASAASATTINDDPVEGESVETKTPVEFPITISNRTGFGIKELYISASDSDDWSDNFLDETLQNGETIRIMVVDSGKYDISITYFNDVECELRDVSFQKTTNIKITLSADGTTTTFSY